LILDVVKCKSFFTKSKTNSLESSISIDCLRYWSCWFKCCLLRTNSCTTKSSKFIFHILQFHFFLNFIFLDLFLESSFYNEALELSRGYKPLTEKLVEPIQPLQIDPTSRFNILSELGAQVGLLFELFLLFLLLNKFVNHRDSIKSSKNRVIYSF
jgi:hypothetical protein